MFRDGDKFVFAHALGQTLVGVVSEDALADWTEGKTLTIQHPQKVVGFRDGQIGIGRLHPLLSPQASIMVRDCLLEEIGDVTGNGGSCTECPPVFTLYLSNIRDWATQRSGILVPTHPPIQLVKG